MMKTFLITTGDPSGDLYGSLLIRALKREQPGIRFWVVGGPLMRSALESQDLFLQDLASFGVSGFFSPLKLIPIFLKLNSKLRALLSSQRPNAVICIDFYGFNRRVLSLARKFGAPTYYFISPQVWASRPGRIRRLQRLVDHMLVIFPFEEKIYQKAGIPVTYVGHPLLDLIPLPEGYARAPSKTFPLGLLPGSRESEIRRHLPIFLNSISRLIKDYPLLEIFIFAAPHLPDSLYTQYLEHFINEFGVRTHLVRESDYAKRSQMRLVLTSSGTATVENALLGLPMVVVYKMAWPSYALARCLIRVPHITMANILARKALVPELIQGDARPELVADAARKLLENPRNLDQLACELAGLREKLGPQGATARVAKIILSGDAVSDKGTARDSLRSSLAT